MITKTGNVLVRYALALAAAVVLLSPPAAAVDDAKGAYPTRPVTMIVPYGAGGGFDGIARPVAERLSSYLKQPVVVENKPGAAGNVGVELVVKAAPNGYTILAGGDPITSNHFLFKNVAWNPSHDLEAISFLGRTPRVLVARPGLGARTLPELVKLSQQQPLSYSTPGVGTGAHLLMEMMKMEYGFKGIHTPYKGNAQAASDAIGGHIDLMVVPLPAVMGFIKSEKLQPIVLLSAKRSPLMPELPVPSEYGLHGLEGDQWYALFAPRSTPEPILRKLNEAARAVLDDAMKNRLLKAGYDAEAGSREELRELVRTSSLRWSKVIQAMNLTPQ